MVWAACEGLHRQTMCAVCHTCAGAKKRACAEWTQALGVRNNRLEGIGKPPRSGLAVYLGVSRMKSSNAA